MRVFALVVIKNEGDIIYDVIKSALNWADKVFVMDNMSSDETPEKIYQISEESDKVIFWGKYEGKFNEGLRQILFREYRSIADDDDWWCRLDGDEFYIDNPKEFINALPSEIDHIYNASFQYYYTEKDYFREKNKAPDSTGSYKDLNWFICNHSEIRFVRNKNFLCWPQGEGWPCNLSTPCKNRIRLKHFQYRTLQQIKNRLQIRSFESIGDTFKHEIVSDDSWYKRRGFSIPSNSEYKKHRIVESKDLKNSNDFEIPHENIPSIENIKLKKKIKNIFILFYMKFLNGYTFKI